MTLLKSTDRTRNALWFGHSDLEFGRSVGIHTPPTERTHKSELVKLIQRNELGVR